MFAFPDPISLNVEVLQSEKEAAGRNVSDVEKFTVYTGEGDESNLTVAAFNADG